MKWLIVLGLIMVFPACAAEVKRNVILFVCDDLGFQLGCYGDRAAKTPNIDALAAEGMRFTRAFCTTASCSPSRSVILSGLYSHANGQYGLEHASHHFNAHKNLRTLPVLLAAGGVRTARAGKFHVGPEETFHFESALPGNARDATKMADNCRTFLAAADPRPFFLYFCPADPHRSGPRRGDPPGGPDPFGNPREEKDGVTFDPKAMPVPPWLPDSEPCRAELAQDYQSIARVDRGLGRLRALLKEAGRDKDTMIIFTSDNGPPWPGAKTTTYEPGVNLPLIISDPHTEKKGLVSEAMVSWVDLAPTVLEACGVGVPRAPRGFHGVSIMPALAGGKLDRPAEVYLSHTFHEVTMYYPVRAVRTEKWKLSLNLAHQLPFPFASDLFGSATWQHTLQSKAERYGRRTVNAYVQRPRVELYDVSTDPDELQNRAGDPACVEIRRDLEANLKAWQQRTGDPWFIKYEHE